MFSQLITQIREAVRSGELKPGTPLPTIRQLAADLQINPNTVAKAFRLVVIAIAEDCGLIVPIGRWVLREACREASGRRTAGLLPGCIAVNISAVELRAPGFVPGVRAILADTGPEARYLELELTETFLMQDSKSTAAILKELRDVGV